MSKMYLVRWRNPDGSWDINVEATMTKREAEKTMQINRIMEGRIGQPWPYEEWMRKLAGSVQQEGEI